MNITINIICDNLKEEAALNLIAIDNESEIDQKVQNMFVIESKDIRRAADLLHAIGKVFESATGVTVSRGL